MVSPEQSRGRRCARNPVWCAKDSKEVIWGSSEELLVIAPTLSLSPYVRVACLLLAAYLLYALCGPYSCRGARVSDDVLLEITAKELHYYYNHYMYDSEPAQGKGAFHVEAFRKYVARRNPSALETVLSHFSVFDHPGSQGDTDHVLAVSAKAVGGRVLVLYTSGRKEWVAPADLPSPYRSP